MCVVTDMYHKRENGRWLRTVYALYISEFQHRSCFSVKRKDGQNRKNKTRLTNVNENRWYSVC